MFCPLSSVLGELQFQSPSFLDMSRSNSKIALKTQWCSASTLVMYSTNEHEMQ